MPATAAWARSHDALIAEKNIGNQLAQNEMLRERDLALEPRFSVSGRSRDALELGHVNPLRVIAQTLHVSVVVPFVCR